MYQSTSRRGCCVLGSRITLQVSIKVGLGYPGPHLTSCVTFLNLFPDTKMDRPSTSTRYGDPDYEEQLLKWYDEIEDDDNEIDNVEESEHDSCSELEISDDEYEERELYQSEQAVSDPEYQDNDSEQVLEKSKELIDEKESTPEEKSENDQSRTKAKGPKSYFGKNKYKWSASEPRRFVRTACENIISHLPGLRGAAKNLGYSADALSVFIVIYFLLRLN